MTLPAWFQTVLTWLPAGAAAVLTLLGALVALCTALHGVFALLAKVAPSVAFFGSAANEFTVIGVDLTRAMGWLKGAIGWVQNALGGSAPPAAGLLLAFALATSGCKAWFPNGVDSVLSDANTVCIIAHIASDNATIAQVCKIEGDAADIARVIEAMRKSNTAGAREATATCKP